MASNLFAILLDDENVSRQRRPDLVYVEKKVKGEIDRVIVELKGNESGSMTRLAARYDRLDKAIKVMGQKRDELNQQLKGEVEELFAAEDEVLTRVIDTVSFTMTVSKKEKQKDKVAVDYQKIAEELAKLIGEDLQAQVTAIYEAYTKVTAQPDKSPALRVKGKIEEGIWDDTRREISSFTHQNPKNVSTTQILSAVAAKMVSAVFKKIKNWAPKFDKKLEVLKLKLQAI